MAKTIVGLYDDLHSAQKAVRDLEDNGIGREDISLVASDVQGEYARAMGTQGVDEVPVENASDRASGAAGGAGVGAILGGLGGVLLGLGALAIPGIGPVVAAGPIVAGLAGAGVGAVAGGLVGALTTAGVPEEDAKVYAEGVRRGGTLLTVHAVDDRTAKRAIEIMNRYDPADVNQRAAEWREKPASTPAPQTTERERENRPASASTASMDPNRVPSLAELDVQRSAPPARREADTADLEAPRGRMIEEVVIRRRYAVDDSGTSGTEMSPAEARVRDEAWAQDVDTTVPARDRDLDMQAPGKMAEREQEPAETVEHPAADTFEGNEPEFHRHYDEHFADSGYTFEQYLPIYRYGYDLHHSDLYGGRDWRDVEPEIRKEWERINPGNPWDKFKDAVHEGWDMAEGS